MKRMKKIAALMLAVVIMCLSFITVYAEGKNKDTREVIEKMKYLCEDAYHAFRASIPFFTEEIPGSVDPNYLELVNRKEIDKVFNEGVCMIYAYDGVGQWPEPTYEGEITLEKATELYNKMYEALHSAIVERAEVEELVALCEKENNDNGYYDEQLWNDFQSEIADAKELLADESIVDTRVTTAFYELMYQYDLLCVSNKVASDVDFDGVVTVLDATYIQRYLVGITTLNSSQVILMGEYRFNDVNIMDATFVQRHCANYPGAIDGLALKRLDSNYKFANPKSDIFMFGSIQYNWIYYRL